MLEIISRVRVAYVDWEGRGDKLSSASDGLEAVVVVGDTFDRQLNLESYFLLAVDKMNRTLRPISQDTLFRIQRQRGRFGCLLLQGRRPPSITRIRSVIS